MASAPDLKTYVSTHFRRKKKCANLCDYSIDDDSDTSLQDNSDDIGPSVASQYRPNVTLQYRPNSDWSFESTCPSELDNQMSFLKLSKNVSSHRVTLSAAAAASVSNTFNQSFA